MKQFLNIKIIFLCLMLGFGWSVASASETAEKHTFSAKEEIMSHVGDAYDWHITTIGDHHISIPLPIIVLGNNGLKVFLSSKVAHGEIYEGYYISQSEAYKGKIVEKVADGTEVRPWDFSITKNALSLLINGAILLVIILGVASFYKRQKISGVRKAPRGFVGFIEVLVMHIENEVVKPCVGKNYARFSPYLQTVFFFILVNNLMGLVPFFPGGTNVTGNIAITLVLAVFTFVFVNLFGTREYWKEIFWPDVPAFLKVIPIIPVIEFVGVFTKPFALMIRLFANILAGHSIAISLVCLIFIVHQSPAMGSGLANSMTLVSVLLSTFMSLLEVLVAFLQAYVFTLLSAVFIGLAQVEPHTAKH